MPSAQYELGAPKVPKIILVGLERLEDTSSKAPFRPIIGFTLHSWCPQQFRQIIRHVPSHCKIPKVGTEEENSRPFASFPATCQASCQQLEPKLAVGGCAGMKWVSRVCCLLPVNLKSIVSGRLRDLKVSQPPLLLLVA